MRDCVDGINPEQSTLAIGIRYPRPNIFRRGSTRRVWRDPVDRVEDCGVDLVRLQPVAEPAWRRFAHRNLATPSCGLPHTTAVSWSRLPPVRPGA